MAVPHVSLSMFDHVVSCSILKMGLNLQSYTNNNHLRLSPVPEDRGPKIWKIISALKWLNLCQYHM